MSTNPLNDISRVYLEQVAESAVPGKPAERLSAVTAIPKSVQDAARERTLAKAKAMREKKGIKTEAFVDPEQGEAPSGRSPLQNVSDHPKASVRKKAVKAFKSQMGKEYGGTWKSRSKDPVDEAAKPDYLDFDGDGNKKEAMKKALKDKAKQKVEEAKKANDGNLANNYPPYDKVTRGDVIAGATGKDEMGGKKKKVTKESFSNWRQDLSEVISDTKAEKKITEKQVNNKVVINPQLDLGEAVENLGGQLIEMKEIDISEDIFDEMTESEIFFMKDDLIEEVVEEVFYECLEEGYKLDDIERTLCESLDTSLMILSEAKVTYGHDTDIKSDRLQRVKSAVKKVGKAVARGVGYAAGAAVRGAKAVGREAQAGYARGRGGSASSSTTSSSSSSESSTQKKPSLLSRIGSKLKSGLKKAVAKGARAVSRGARNVARKMEGGEAPKVVTPAPKAPAKPKAKAPARKKKTGKLDDLLADVRKEEIEIEEEKRPFPFKKVEAQKEKARKGSVYGKPATNEPAPNVSDKEKSETRRFSKMHQTSEKAKREKQVADKARRSSTFYKDTHPASAPKMKKANEEFQIDERTLTAAETKKKEEIVKSMKDKEAEFEKRYPGRGKEVMFATATKVAKKVAEQAMELQPKTQPQQGQQDQKARIAAQKAKQAAVALKTKELATLRQTPAGTSVSTFG